MSTSPPLFPPFSLSLFLHITEKSEILKRGGGGVNVMTTPPPVNASLHHHRTKTKYPPPPPPTNLACAHDYKPLRVQTYEIIFIIWHNNNTLEKLL